MIIADCYYKRRPTEEHVRDNMYRGKLYPFDIIHFQVKSPWLDRGLWVGQAPWNQEGPCWLKDHIPSEERYVGENYPPFDYRFRNEYLWVTSIKRGLRGGGEDRRGCQAPQWIKDTGRLTGFRP